MDEIELDRASETLFRNKLLKEVLENHLESYQHNLMAADPSNHTELVESIAAIKALRLLEIALYAPYHARTYTL